MSLNQTMYAQLIAAGVSAKEATRLASATTAPVDNDNPWANAPKKKGPKTPTVTTATASFDSKSGVLTLTVNVKQRSFHYDKEGNPRVDANGNPMMYVQWAIPTESGTRFIGMNVPTTLFEPDVQGLKDASELVKK